MKNRIKKCTSRILNYLMAHILPLSAFMHSLSIYMTYLNSIFILGTCSTFSYIYLLLLQMLFIIPIILHVVYSEHKPILMKIIICTHIIDIVLLLSSYNSLMFTNSSLHA